MSLLERTRTRPDPPSLTDRYLDAVAHEVPRTRRDEVTGRLRSTIDAGVVRRAARGVPRAEAERQELAELGEPSQVAGAAVGPRWLVGPRLYGDYLRVLRMLARVVLPVVAVLVALGNGIAGEHPAQVVAASLSATVEAGIHLVFWVTLVFAVLDRRGVVLHAPERAWSPDDLPAARPGRVGIGETIASVAVQTLLLGVVLWSWQYRPSAQAEPVPVLAESLRPTVTAVLVVVLLAGITLALVAYRVGRWTPWMAVATTVLDTVFAGVVIWLVGSGRLLDPAFVDALGAGPLLDEPAALSAATVLGTVAAWAVGIGCAVDVVDTWRKALRAGY